MRAVPALPRARDRRDGVGRTVRHSWWRSSADGKLGRPPPTASAVRPGSIDGERQLLGRRRPVGAAGRHERSVWRSALGLAQEAVAAGADLALPESRRLFVYMPDMHSESRAIHDVAEQLFRERTPQDRTHEVDHIRPTMDRVGMPASDRLGRSHLRAERRRCRTPVAQPMQARSTALPPSLDTQAPHRTCRTSSGVTWFA
jgi:hypothetical protein